jgi:tetratricopeptide (TPR) repeat protein
MDKAVKDLTDKRAAQIYNDAGFLSAGRGQTRKARAYYKKAIELSPIYFEKAEANLLALLDTEVKSGT